MHLVTVWASESGLTLGQIACEEKSNEITAIPEGWPLKNSPEFSNEYINVSRSGLELKSVRYEYGSAQPQTDVISLEKDDIPDSEFEVPGDYENVGFKEFLMMMSQE